MAFSPRNKKQPPPTTSPIIILEENFNKLLKEIAECKENKIDSIKENVAKIPETLKDNSVPTVKVKQL